ncbi:hypothetical protein [Fulvivirga sp.]|uniref:hypothetical protein n=1 Tax=Fulvivirga sp. TaxID=1931237 RepID=UPI0032EF948F
MGYATRFLARSVAKHLKQMNRSLIYISLFLLSCSAEQTDYETEVIEIPQFDLREDFSEFTSKLNEGDTMIVGVHLTLCAWLEADRIEITKSNDSLFMQVTDKWVGMTDTFNFKKLPYPKTTDEFHLERMLQEMKDKTGPEFGRPFFTITSTSSADTIQLCTNGRGNRDELIGRYITFMGRVYHNKGLDYGNGLDPIIEKYGLPDPYQSEESEELN